jgi:electron transport complex protein RnfA
MRLISLALFSAMSVNLLLHLGLALPHLTREKPCGAVFVAFKALSLFCSSLTVWLLFTLAAFPLGLGSAALLLPLSALSHLAYGRLIRLLVFPSLDDRSCLDDAGLCLAVVFFTLRLARNTAEALVLILGFTLGLFCSLLILNEIEKRSRLEAVPPLLRGSPLLLISTAFLSLIFSSVAAILLNAADFF